MIIIRSIEENFHFCTELINKSQPSALSPHVINYTISSYDVKPIRQPITAPDIHFVPFPSLTGFCSSLLWGVDQSSSNPPNNTTNLIAGILKLDAAPVKLSGEARMEDVVAGEVPEAIPTLPTVPVEDELDPAGIG